MAKLTDDYIRKMAQDYTYNPKYNDPGIGEALEELLVLRERTRWIPITERYPDELQEVLRFTQGYDYMLACRINGEWVSTQGSDVDIYCDVNCWMPLPEPPEVKE